MTHVPRRAAGTLGCALSMVLAAGALTPSATAEDTGRADWRRTVHSSDGVAGPIAAPVGPSARTRVAASNERGYRVSPGLTFRRWDETDARGQYRVYLLKANLAKPGLSLQYGDAGKVTHTDTLTGILRRSRAIAGVNGDFYDITDTGAPLGIGVDEGRVLHGPSQNWVHSFTVQGKDRPSIGDAPVLVTVVGRPGIHVTNYNSPQIPPMGIGVYTRRWGKSPGYAVVEGAVRSRLRQVVVRNGRVVSNTRRLSTGDRIRGRVLIGRGDAAATLRKRLPVGTSVQLTFAVDGSPRVGISGSEQLLDNGVVTTTDDGELHPRTAVGIDRDTGRVLLLVVDGRQDFSRGLTLVELARLMRRLGAEEALNLDGGGSSTMVTRRPSGRVRVANSPSGGQQRRVANGLAFVYRTP